MTVLFDADSLVWASCFKAESDLEKAKIKYDTSFDNILTNLYGRYDIDTVITFNNSAGNFRKLLDNNYKANRRGSGISYLLNELHNYVTDKYNGIKTCGVETDDLVARYWNHITKEEGRDNVIILALDKDYMQLPALIYNYHYNHQCMYDISEVEALNNFYTQMIVGDTIDNVNYCRGYGKKYAEKLLAECTTHYQFTKKVYELFKKIYKQKAKLKYIQCYNLLRLRTE
jgi:5'-3' exonuclease